MKKMKAMFSHLPLNIENIDLTIFFRDEDGSELSDPNIGIASISRGKLEYLTLETNGSNRYVKGKLEESHEEARKLINQ